MASRTVTISSAAGLHAAAAVIAGIAAGYQHEVLLHIDADDYGTPDPADAASALMIMALGAAHGDAVTVTSPDAGAVDTIASVIESGGNPPSPRG